MYIVLIRDVIQKDKKKYENRYVKYIKIIVLWGGGGARGSVVVKAL
jgi:hypothetical protein